MSDQPEAGAQPVADANSIDGIIDNAPTELKPEAPKVAEPEKVEDKPDDREDDTLFPKKAVNALSRRDKQIGKLRAELAMERQEREKLLAQHAPKETAKPTADGRPKEADFTNYADYMEAVTDWKIDQVKIVLKTEQAKTTEAATQNQQLTERYHAVDKQAEEFAKTIPEITQVFNDNAELVKSFPQEIKFALLNADNAPLAFYNLAKEGKLADLADMSLVDAKVEIRLAQMRPAVKAQSKAPTPLSTSRGSVASSKSLDAMSGNELLDWLNT